MVLNALSAWPDTILMLGLPFALHVREGLTQTEAHQVAICVLQALTQVKDLLAVILALLALTP